MIGYSVSDDEWLADSASLFVTVENINDAPVAVADFVDVDRPDTVMVDVLANDVDVDIASGLVPNQLDK